MPERLDPNVHSRATYQPLTSAQEQFQIPRKPLPSQIKAQEPTVDSVKGESHKPRSSSWSIEFTRWWPELLASLLSIIALIAIVIVLKVYEGRSIDNLNLPSYLTLNGLIALIATFDRIFLVIPIGSALSQDAWLWFAQNNQKNYPRSRLRDLSRSDAASRGAWGSLIFIFTSPYRYFGFIAAVISLLSLAISTFTQQLIVVRNVPLLDRASPLQAGNLPRSEYYNLSYGNPSEGEISTNQNMIGAIYNGLISESVDPIQAICPTGNCSWPITPSIAVCGGCAPISPIRTVCNSTYMSGYCNFTMPSGSVFQLANMTAPDRKGQGFQVMTSSGQHWNKSIPDHLYVANFDMMGAPFDSVSGSLSFANMMNASECALWLCINAYNTSMSLGKQTQNLVSSFYNIQYPIHSSIVNYTFNYPNRMMKSNDSSYTNYTVSDFAQVALSQRFGSSYINGNVTININSHITPNDIVQAIWAGSQDPNTWIQTVATSMSNVVRSFNPSPREEFVGTAYVQSITVAWWWLSLPIAVVAGSVLLLLAVMIKTARSSVPPWRDNPNALLLLEMDDDTRNMAAAEISNTKIDSELRQEKVVLRKSDAGSWMLGNHRS